MIDVFTAFKIKTELETCQTHNYVTSAAVRRLNEPDDHNFIFS